jgi:predicted negative regulator of RcsB-dependent stress response
MTQQTIETEGWTFADWIQANTRAVGIGAAIVVLVGLGFWYNSAKNAREQRSAERGLMQAKQSLAAGNLALAQTDLQRVATSYQGTAGGVLSAMILAQLDFDQGKFAEGLKVIEPYENAKAAGASLPGILALKADGLMASGKAGEAATAYERAAAATSLPGERATYLAKAGRAYMAVGKNAEAKVIWERLAIDPDAPFIRNEAYIRLGELSATAGKS